MFRTRAWAAAGSAKLLKVTTSGVNVLVVVLNVPPVNDPMTVPP